MRKVVFLLGAFFVAGMVVFLSCERDEMALPDDNLLLQQAENDAVSEAVLQNVEELIDREIDMLEKLNYDISALKSASVEECDPVRTIKTEGKNKFPKTITLDWGPGCEDSNGNVRAGKVVVHITGPYWEKNTVRHAKLEDYHFNDLIIAGQREEKNKGTNEEGYYLFEIKHSLKITKAEGGELVSDRDWYRERIYDRGKDLKVNSDDRLWVNGSAKVDNKETQVEKEITVTLYRELGCEFRHFQSGVITTFVKKEKTAELNYGNGECDNKATWTNLKTGRSKTITLKTGVNHFSTKK